MINESDTILLLNIYFKFKYIQIYIIEYIFHIYINKLIL